MADLQLKGYRFAPLGEREPPNCKPNIDQMIGGNFDKALSHPDENDLKALKKAVAE